MALALPNELLLLGSPVLGLVCMAPLYAALKKCRGYGSSARLCALHVFLTHLLSSWWLGNFHGMGVATLGASAVGTAGIGFAFGCYIHFLFKARFKFLPEPLAFAAIWTFYEWAKSTGFLAYPWGTVYMSSYQWPLIMQLAEFTGVYGISFLFILFSAALVERRNLRFAAFTACLFLMAVIHGALCLAQRRVPVKGINAVVTQQNIDPWELPGDEEAILLSKNLTELGLKEFEKAGEEADIVIWTEGVLRRPFPSSMARYSMIPLDEPLTEYMRKKDLPFLIGGAYAIDPLTRRNGNAALFFKRGAILDGCHIKIHLVPFAEVIPFHECDAVRDFVRHDLGLPAGWTPGSRLPVFELPLASGKTARFTAPICFEDAFPDICGPLWHEGSEAFLNITNDSWSKTKSAELQHFVVASFRCIEYRTTMLRACNSGYTAVIGPDGRVLQDIPLFQETYMAARVPIFRRTLTFYAIYGNWLPQLLLLLLLTQVLINVTLSSERGLQLWESVRFNLRVFLSSN